VLLPTGWQVGVLFYLALGYGPLYTFLFGSRQMNRSKMERAALVLRATGVGALLLLVAMFRVGVGQLAPGLTGRTRSWETWDGRI